MPPSARVYVVQGVKIRLEVLQDICDGLPTPMSTVINLVVRIVILTETIKTNRTDCDLLRDHLLQLLIVVAATVTKHLASSEDSWAIRALALDIHHIRRLIHVLEIILKTLSNVHNIVSSKGIRNRLKASLLARSNASAIVKCRNDLDWALREFQVHARLRESVNICELSREVDSVHTRLNNTFIESLPRAKYASYRSERPDSPSNCLEGTRTGILDTISDWTHSSDGDSSNIFFLNGIAGVGKTSIAHTVAARAESEGILGADYFCSRQGEAELRDAAMIIPTIAYRLAQFDPEFNQHISAGLERDPQGPYGSFSQQLDLLILKPLSGVNHARSRPVLIVLDAIDECETEGAAEVLRLLVAAIPKLPYFLKIFITGRPEAHIPSALLHPSSLMKTVRLHDIESVVVRADIELYIRTSLRALPRAMGLDLPPDWIMDREIGLLVEKAGNLFVWALTAIRFLSDPVIRNPRRRLDELLDDLYTGQGTPHLNPFRELDALYMHVLLGLRPVTDTSEVLVVKTILGTVVLLREPLPQDAMEGLAGLQCGRSSGLLRQLQSIIVPPVVPHDHLSIYHPSFPDFIQNPARCPDPRFYIETPVHEARMAGRCLALLIASLRNDVLGDLGPGGNNSDVEDSGVKIRVAYSTEVLYSCRFWASHLVNAPSDSEATDALREALGRFVRSALPAWVEAMSWLGEMQLVVKCLEDASVWAVASLCSPQVIEELKNKYRFVLTNFSTITDSATYSTHPTPLDPSPVRLEPIPDVRPEISMKEEQHDVHPQPSTPHPHTSVPPLPPTPSPTTFQNAATASSAPASESKHNRTVGPPPTTQDATTPPDTPTPPDHAPHPNSFEPMPYPDIVIEEHQIVLDTSEPVNTSGGFCDLFVGQYATVGKVALKRLRMSEYGPFGGSDAERRFIREGVTWCSLKHRFILPFLGVYKTRHLFLVSPFAEYGALPSYLRQFGSEADRPRFLAETAEAIAYLHAQKVIHGDIKGANILVSSDHHILLCDFGLARLSNVASSNGQHGVGTTRWQSPEIVFDDGSRSYESDVYAYGMTIYEVLSGNPPFFKLVNWAVCVAIHRGERPPQEPASSPQGTSYAELWAIASRCWSTDPELRPSMREVCVDISPVA